MSELVVSGNTWQAMKEQSGAIVKSGLLPASVNTPEKAMTIALMGHELRMPIMWSLNNIDVIQGKATLKPAGMLALIFKNCPGAMINYIKQTDDACEIEAKRPGGKMNTFTFTMTDARKMQLDSKDNWKKQPRVMLKWRCVAEMARALFPDALSGILYTPEELDPDMQIDEEGNTIVVTPHKNESEKQKQIAKVEPKLVAHMIDADPSASYPIDHVITIGKKFNGKNINQIPRHELDGWLNWASEASKNEGKPVSRGIQEIMDKIDEWMASESLRKKNDGPPPGMFDDLPF